MSHMRKKEEESVSPEAKLYIFEIFCEEFSDIWHICQNSI